MNNKRFHFFIACAFAVAVFVVYQSFYGTKHSQAYASLGAQDAKGELYNYKPARKRILRSRLKMDSDGLLELTGHDVMQIFAKPELVRRDVPTTIWQYRNDTCVLDVYFTVGRSADVARSDVVHYEVRGRDTRSKTPFDASACVQGLLANDTMMSLINVDAVYKTSSN